MALRVVAVLAQRGGIDQHQLATVFASNYAREPWRGYGGMAHAILNQLGAGHPWRQVASAAFGGEGSMGNGGAMRVAPVGAYFADDFQQAAYHASLSAQVTHAHPEGQAGAIGVAVAAAWTWSTREQGHSGAGLELLETAARYTPKGDTRRGLERACALPFSTTIDTAVCVLGNGSHVTAPDTVPFALWAAARHLDNFQEALWSTVSGLGDRDTTCAIVGGIVALASGEESIPEAWLQAREPLPTEVG
jgi:ADP-ribosylglycohydrolase